VKEGREAKEYFQEGQGEESAEGKDGRKGWKEIEERKDHMRIPQIRSPPTYTCIHTHIFMCA
jgi:hypothetical protein